MLWKRGCRVTSDFRVWRSLRVACVVRDARAALAAMATFPPPTVVLCDVHLRDGPNGLWLADRIRERHPTTAMILATGDSTVAPVDSLRKGIIAYLIKPFRREDVIQAGENGHPGAHAEGKKDSG